MNRTDRMRLHLPLDNEVSDLYNYALQKLEEADLSLDLGRDDHPLEQLHGLKLIIDKLTTKRECEDCAVYEKQLQKLEADIRQHIKVRFHPIS